MEFAFAFFDGHVVDTRFPMTHQPFLVKLPEFVAVGPEPMPVGIVVLILEADSDPVLREAPQ